MGALDYLKSPIKAKRGLVTILGPMWGLRRDIRYARKLEREEKLEAKAKLKIVKAEEEGKEKPLEKSFKKFGHIIMEKEKLIFRIIEEADVSEY
ncbi:hypothetical protein ACFL96_19520, partial [Thermoproteota archaeon]